MADEPTESDKSLGLVIYAVHQLNDHRVLKDGCDTGFDIMSLANPKAGSVKYTRMNTGETVIVQPGDQMYSTATMLAEEYFDGVIWKKTGDI